jgi:hypothetical protein
MAKVAVLGFGVMGYPMAGHLTKKGHEVTVYNRAAARAQTCSAYASDAYASSPCAVSLMLIVFILEKSNATGLLFRAASAARNAVPFGPHFCAVFRRRAAAAYPIEGGAAARNSPASNCCSGKSPMSRLNAMYPSRQMRTGGHRRSHCSRGSRQLVRRFGAVLYHEGLYRNFANQRDVAAYAGFH